MLPVKLSYSRKRGKVYLIDEERKESYSFKLGQFTEGLEREDYKEVQEHLTEERKLGEEPSLRKDLKLIT